MTTVRPGAAHPPRGDGAVYECEAMNCCAATVSSR
jgi:hypothetical protein